MSSPAKYPGQAAELLRVELVGEQGQFRLQASAQAGSTDAAFRLGGQAADRPGRRLPRRRITVARSSNGRRSAQRTKSSASHDDAPRVE